MILGIAAILIVVATTILVATGTIKEKYFPYCIGIMALGLVYSTTILGPYIIGSDIHGEILTSRNALKYDWDFTNATGINANAGISASSIVTGVLAPFLSKLLHIDIVWIYKAIIPLFLVGVPVILYYAFRKQIGDKRAFFATLFFIIMPIYNLEITQIAKSMVAELFFALMILAMVSTWRWQYKGLVIFFCTALATASHYSVGLAMICYLLGILITRIITSRIKWKLFAIKQVSITLLLSIILISSGTFFVYYHYAFGGTVNQVIGRVAKYYNNVLMAHTEQILVKLPEPAPELSFGQSPEKTKFQEIAAKREAVIKRIPLQGREGIIKVALGLDFLTQPLEGKLFRIIQYLTQILVVIGVCYLLFRYQKYKFTAEFVAGIGCSFVLLALCVLIPNFSNIINMSRFYHISLFFLAPMLVIGCDAISNIRVKKSC